MADVESSNVVGYNTSTLNAEAGDYIHNIGVAYKNIATADGSFTITDSILDTKLQDGDALLIFNPDAYNYDFYSYCDTDGEGTMGFFVTYGDLENEGFVTDAETVILPAGQGGLYMPSGDRVWNVTLNY